MLLTAVALLFVARLYKGEPFFERRREVADPKLLEPAPAVAGGAG